MNLSEALDAALPEIPKARLARSRPPRLDPELLVREMCRTASQSSASCSATR